MFEDKWKRYLQSLGRPWPSMDRSVNGLQFSDEAEAPHFEFGFAGVNYSTLQLLLRTTDLVSVNFLNEIFSKLLPSSSGVSNSCKL